MPISRAFSLIVSQLVLFTSAALLGVAAALGGEVDLKAAGCPDFLPAGEGLAFMIVLKEDGSAEACEFRAQTYSWCSNMVYDPRPGFLCVDFTSQTTPDGNHAEGPLSTMTKSFTIDGIQAPVRENTPYWNFHKDFGTGPSGENYDVVVEYELGNRLFTVTMNLDGVPDTSIEMKSLTITSQER